MTIAIDENLRLRFKKILTRHCNPNDLEDAIQESMIHAWSLISKGEKDEHSVFVKSLLRGRDVASPLGTSTPIGKPRAEVGGYSTTGGRETKQRILDYREKYFQEHRKYPTYRQVHRETGISISTINYHLTAKSGNVHTREQAKLLAPHSVAYFEIVPEQFLASKTNLENESLAWITFCQLVSDLTSSEKELMYLRHVEVLTNEEISQCLGKSERTVRTYINQAHLSLRNHILAAQHP